MKDVTKILLLVLALQTWSHPADAPPTPRAGAAELIQTLDKLNVLGSLLMVGAHPDDENTAVIAYFARGRHIRTAYLSATRGEGGQNLIGPEQYEALGLIRTQELLAARRIDGGEQFFTRAFDFGFSKSPEEALQKWGRERLLSDMVRVIRRFRPDVIVARFSPTGGGGHGQHTATGHVAPAAFESAGDAAKFPEQIAEGLKPWRARRLLWMPGIGGGRRPPGRQPEPAGRLRVDAGQFDSVLGKSYAEIAGESRSQHASQGFGSAERKGPSPQTFAYTAGEDAKSDPFDGIDTTWKRVPGGARVGELLARGRQELRLEKPDSVLPLLVDAYREMSRLDDPWIEIKRGELLHAIQLVTGLWLDAAADRWNASPGSQVQLTLTALNRSGSPLAWHKVAINGVEQPAPATVVRPLALNAPQQLQFPVTIPSQTAYSQPYWMREVRTADFYPVSEPRLIGLAENPPRLVATFYIRAGEAELPFQAPVHYRWVDQVTGEHTRPLEIVPQVAVSFAAPSMIFPEPKPRRMTVRVSSDAGAAKGSVSLELPAGWRADPANAPFDLTGGRQQVSLSLDVSPPAGASGGYAAARAHVGDVMVTSGVVSIRYPHIPPQVIFPPARVRLERFDVRLTARNIGYVMGPGDDVPQALEQLGASVKLLSTEDLAGGDLTKFDAIVTGIRALDIRDDLFAARGRLLEYVSKGGTLVVQYLRAEASRTAQFAPYPLKPSNFRVTEEDAPVTFPNPDLPVLHRPNEISARDFEGWVQERGLYFMGEWDKRYLPVFACKDAGEPLRLGGTLYARYGQGVYIYTAYSWFRQLPAGVPGAYRIFANLVSARDQPAP